MGNNDTSQAINGTSFRLLRHDQELNTMQLKTTNVVNLRNDVVTLQQTIATAKRCDSAKDSLERVLITMLWLHSPRSVLLGRSHW